MLDWCYNTLVVCGEPAEVRRFIDACMGLPADWPLEKWEIERGAKKLILTDKYFSFNALVPVPKEVVDFGYSSLSAKETIELLCGKSQGPLDGYHWCRENWGTPWDVYSNHYTADDFTVNGDGTEASLDFSTTWSPPIAWMCAASKQFPKLTLTLEYVEPDCFFSIRSTTCRNGEAENEFFDDDEFFGDDEEDEDDEE